MDLHQISGPKSLTNGQTKQHKVSISPDKSNVRPKTPHLPKINTRYDRGTSAFLCVGRDGSKPPPASSFVRTSSAKSSSKRREHADENETDSSWTGVLEPETQQSCTLQITKSPEVLPPISPRSPKHTDDDEEPDRLEGDSVQTVEGDVEHALPPTSSIFQQALSDLKNRRSSDEDPGDLMVRRSSLTSTLINMGAIKTYPSLIEPGKKTETIREEVIAEDYSEHRESLQPLNINEEDLKSKRVRANWRRARSKMNCNRFNKKTTTSQGKNAPRVVDEIDDKRETTTPPEVVVSPKMKQLWKKSKSNIDSASSTCILGDQHHDLHSLHNSSSGESLQTRPVTNWRKTTSVISLKTVGQITRLMSIAGASSCSPGVSSKSNNLLSNPEEGRLMHRERRESLRLIKQTLDAIRNHEDDLTEVCGFDELRNCRYLRTRHSSDRRRSSLLGFNEI